MRLSAAFAVAALVVAQHLPPAPAWAQDSKLEVRNTDTVRSLLERQVGKRVSVVLTKPR